MHFSLQHFGEFHEHYKPEWRITDRISFGLKTLTTSLDNSGICIYHLILFLSGIKVGMFSLANCSLFTFSKPTINKHMFNIPFNIHIPSFNNLVWKTDGILKKVMILTHSQMLLFLFEFACLKYLFLPMQTVTSHSHWQVWLLFLYVQVFLPRELKDFVTHKITWSKFNASLYNTCTPSASLIRTSVRIKKLGPSYEVQTIFGTYRTVWKRERGVHWLH